MLMKFSERLKELRKEKGFTQRALARRLNYGCTTIANYERGKNRPKFEDLIKLADLLDTSIDYLLGVSDIRYEMMPYKMIEKKILKTAIQNDITLVAMDRLIIWFIYQTLKKNYSDEIQKNDLHNDKEAMKNIMQSVEKKCCVEFSERFYYCIRNDLIRDAIMSQI